MTAALLLTSLGAHGDLPDHAAISRGPVPPWVIEVEPEEVPPASENTAGLALRLIDDQVWVDGQRSSVYRQWVVEVLSQQGLDEAAQWEVGFDPKYQKVLLHHLAVFREGVWRDRIGSATASVLQLESDLGRQVYDGSLTMLLVLEDVRVGDLVRFAYTVEGFNPVLGDRYVRAFSLGWGAPVSERRIRLLTSQESPLFYRIHGGGPEPVEAAQGGKRELIWHLLDTDAVHQESRTPYDWVTYPTLQVSQFETWEEVVTWGRLLNTPQRPPPELIAVAEDIQSRYPEDPGGQLVAAARWVQDEMRYFAMSLGPHSHAPYEVEQILQRRFGDCKDKTRLLITLLSALDIEAWPALIDATDHAASQQHPSPFAFDHVVVVAQLGEKKIWIDATVELQGGDAANLYFPAYAHGLELREGVVDLTELPLEQSNPGKTTVRYHYRVKKAREPLEVSIVTTWEGREAEISRRSMASTPIQELQDNYVEFYADGSATVEPTAPLEVEDDRDANRIQITEHYSYEGCWKKSRGRFRCSLLPLLLADELPEPDVAKRQAPLRLPRQKQFQEIVTLEADPSWNLGAVNEMVKNEWFSFRVSSTRRAGKIDLHYDLATRAEQVEPEAMESYLREVDEMDQSVGYFIYSGRDSGGKDSTGGGSLYPRWALPLTMLILGASIGRRVADWRWRKVTAFQEGMVPCEDCQSATAWDQKFCGQCGVALDRPAPDQTVLDRPE